jgi:hypothetical protein
MNIGLFDFGDGGAQRTKWQRQHRARKNREAALAARRALRASEKADLQKRLKAWKKKIAKAKREGWVPLSHRRWRNGAGVIVKLGRPRMFKKPIWLDMTGMRFGRWTVMRLATKSRSERNSQRCRSWVVKCSCGSPERTVNGTSLRQGNSKSCGCLLREWATTLGRAQAGKQKSHPLSVKLQLEAQAQRSTGNIRLARLLEQAAPAVRVRERKRRRRQKRKARNATRRA